MYQTVKIHGITLRIKMTQHLSTIIGTDDSAFSLSDGLIYEKELLTQLFNECGLLCTSITRNSEDLQMNQWSRAVI